MKTTTANKANLDRKAKEYVINCIDLVPYDLSTGSAEGDIIALYSIFLREYSHEIAIRQGNEVKAFASWCQGLPSCFNIVFSNYDIIQLGRCWGSLSDSSTEAQEDRILNNYWNFIANKFFQLLHRAQKGLKCFPDVRASLNR